jgi:colanic acid/amylovoran biosynthesis protein
MTPKEPVVAIIGGSIWGNRGAAAMLETTIGKVSGIVPAARFNVFTPYPLKDRQLCPDARLTFFDSRPQAMLLLLAGTLLAWITHSIKLGEKLSPAVRAIAEANVLFDVGGITFADGRLIFLPYNILTIWPAILLKVPVVKLSQAAGSFRNIIIRTFARLFLPRCRHIFARGELTYAFIQELGLKEDKLSPSADIAFCYRPEYCLSKENQHALQQVFAKMDSAHQNGQKIVSISPSVLVMQKSGQGDIVYTRTLLDLLSKSSMSAIHYVVFPNASREGSKKTRNNDIIAIEQMRAEAELTLPRAVYDQVTWLTFDINSAGIDSLVQRTDVLVTSRFHAMVFGLRLCIPTLVIGWGHKYMETMQRFNQQAYVFDYRHPSRNLMEVLQEMLSNNQSIRAALRAALDAEIQSSNSQFEYVRAFFDDQKTPS